MNFGFLEKPWNDTNYIQVHLEKNLAFETVQQFWNLKIKCDFLTP
jgi:hypothetical protein